MTRTLRVLCLGAGRWGDGLTVAGRVVAGGTPGSWVRLVAPGHTETVAPERARLDTDEPVAPLDVIDVAVGAAVPDGHQQENVAVADAGPWRLVARLTPDRAAEVLDSGRALGKHTDSSGEGQNDRIPFLYTTFLNRSLALLQPEAAELQLAEPTRNTPTGARLIFRAEGRRYNLVVTDAAALARLGTWPQGAHRLDRPLVCVAVSAPVALPADSYSYRLVPGLVGI